MSTQPKTVAELRKPFDERYMTPDAHRSLDELCRRAEANERLREAAATMLGLCHHVRDKQPLREALAAAPSQPKADEVAELRAAVHAACSQLEVAESKDGDAPCAAASHFREAVRTLARTLPPTASKFNRAAVWGELREMDALHEEISTLRTRLEAAEKDRAVWTKIRKDDLAAVHASLDAAGAPRSSGPDEELCVTDRIAVVARDLAELRAKLEAAEQRLTQENDQWADQIAAALCSTADKCGRTPSMLAGHVQREHEAHTRKFNQFIKVRDELEVVKRDLAAARADLAAARAAQRAVAVEELRKLHDKLRGYAVDCERPNVVSVSGDSPKCRAWAYRFAMGKIDDRIAALTAPAAEPAKPEPAPDVVSRLESKRDAIRASPDVGKEGLAYANGIDTAISYMRGHWSTRHADGCRCVECEPDTARSEGDAFLSPEIRDTINAMQTQEGETWRISANCMFHWLIRRLRALEGK